MTQYQLQCWKTLIDFSAILKTVRSKKIFRRSKTPWLNRKETSNIYQRRYTEFAPNLLKKRQLAKLQRGVCRGDKRLIGFDVWWECKHLASLVVVRYTTHQTPTETTKVRQCLWESSNTLSTKPGQISKYQVHSKSNFLLNLLILRSSAVSKRAL